MKQAEKFTPKYRQKLVSEINSITRYLEKHTSYFVNMDVKLDNKLGYLYSVKVSVDANFSKYGKWMLYSTGKQTIKDELLEKIIHLDFQNRKNGGTKRITKIVQSTALKIMCCCCEDDVTVPYEIHRNVNSSLFKNREGYVFMCHKCAIQQFSKILNEQDDIYLAFWWICGCYDRRFSKNIVDKVKELPLSPPQQCKDYFKRLNIEKGKGLLFADSDLLNNI